MAKGMHGMMDDYCNKTEKANETKNSQRRVKYILCSGKNSQNLHQNAEIVRRGSLCVQFTRVAHLPSKICSAFMSALKRAHSQ